MRFSCPICFSSIAIQISLFKCICYMHDNLNLSAHYHIIIFAVLGLIFSVKIFSFNQKYSTLQDFELDDVHIEKIKTIQARHLDTWSQTVLQAQGLNLLETPDFLGSDKEVSISERYLENGLFIREARPNEVRPNNAKPNVLNDFQHIIILLHDRHDYGDSETQSGCCSALWLWLGTMHKLCTELKIPIIAIDAPGFGFSKHKTSFEGKSYINSVLERIHQEKYYENLAKITFVAPASGNKDFFSFLQMRLKWSFKAKMFRKHSFEIDLVASNPAIPEKFSDPALGESVQNILLVTSLQENTTLFENIFSGISRKGNFKKIKLFADPDEKRPLGHLDDPAGFHKNVVDFVLSSNQ